MSRRSTILSLPGLIILTILLTGLGLAIWRQGGLAFSPGALSAKNRLDVQSGEFASHAEFEQQCSLCHRPLTSIQADLCVSCHTNVDADVEKTMGLHGIFENARRCSECHSDHQGRDFDIRLGSLDEFDHSQVAFNLIWHQVNYSLVPMECLDCHMTDDEFTVSTESCATCHAGHDITFMVTHLQDFGDGCLTCHDGQDSISRFDHAASEFPLAGSHLETRCAVCHTQGKFENLPKDCVNCHAEPTVHVGIFELDCETCHDSQSWKPALLGNQPFDHFTQTNFSLIQHPKDYSAKPITCDSCHQKGIWEFDPGTCTECHAEDNREFINQHQTQLGENCLECHDGVDRMQNFSHTDYFQLDGRHVEINCQECHQGSVYRNTPQECRDCHPEPEIHAGFFGLQCDYCHDTTSWYPAQLRSHQFPIDHGDQGQVECQVCHVTTYSEYSCYGCHDHSAEEIEEQHQEEGISTQELAACIQCHEDGLEHQSNKDDDD